ncbi:hypothetical protein ACWDZ8_23745 [Streptomyces sp. NPDC003233]
MRSKTRTGSPTHRSGAVVAMIASSGRSGGLRGVLETGPEETGGAVGTPRVVPIDQWDVTAQMWY